MGRIVTHEQLNKFIKLKIKPYIDPNVKNIFSYSDSSYHLPTKNDIQVFLNKFPIKKPVVNLGDGFDCDDYSFVLRGRMAEYNRDILKIKHSISVGIVWGRFKWINEFHAINWVVTHGWKFYWIEPQERRNKQIKDINQCAGNIKLFLI